MEPSLNVRSGIIHCLNYFTIQPHNLHYIKQNFINVPRECIYKLYQFFPPNDEIQIYKGKQRTSNILPNRSLRGKIAFRRTAKTLTNCCLLLFSEIITFIQVTKKYWLLRVPNLSAIYTDRHVVLGFFLDKSRSHQC